MNWYPWFSQFLVLAIGALLVMMPRFARPDIFFGVTVDPGFRRSPDGERITRSYMLQVAAYVTAALAVTAIAVFTGRPGWANAGAGIITVGSLVALARSNRKARPHAAPPNPVREASLETRSDQLPGGLLLWALPLLFLIASGGYLAANWNEIPERFPIHFGLDGQPNGWAKKSVGSVYGMLGMGAVICLMMAVMGLGILRSRRIAYRGSAAEYEQSFRSMNVWGLLAFEYFMAILFASIPVMSTLHPGTTPATVLVQVVVTLILTGVLIAAYVRYGQGGTRLAPQSAVMDPPHGDRTPDDCWIWGSIYYNRDDPAIMVEKRFGLGYTMNFGNVWSWVIMAALLLLPLGGLLIARG